VISILYRVPCPTPDGRSAQDLYEKRVHGFTDEMRAAARALGCRFHRAWYARDGHALYAIAIWETPELAREFSQLHMKGFVSDELWETIVLEGDTGLVTEAHGGRGGGA